MKSRNKRLVGEVGAISSHEQFVQPEPIFMIAAIEAPSHFIEIAVQMFGADNVVNAYDLALEERPNALDTIGVNAKVAHIFARAVVHAMVIIAS